VQNKQQQINTTIRDTIQSHALPLDDSIERHGKTPLPVALLVLLWKKVDGDGSKPYPPGEHQNSW